MEKKKKTKKKSTKFKIIRRIILIILGIALIVGMVLVLPKLTTIIELKKEADSYVAGSSLSTFKDTKTTLIYDTNGEELCAMRNTKDMFYVDFDNIPMTLVESFVKMEDKNFYSHKGYDLKAIIRAIIVNQKSNGVEQGASTITQQLSRNIFLSHEVTWQRKVEEIFIAMGLEKKFTKNQILEFYLNNIYFGNGYYGVEAAAKGYFSKSVGELTLAEQAFIAAIPNNPTLYNPLTNYENTAKRKNLILDVLYNEKVITSLEHNTASSEEVTLVPKVSTDINNSVVTYVRHCATESMMKAQGFSFRYNFSGETDYNNYKELYDTAYTASQQMLLSGGYSIYTSIDMDIEKQLQMAVDNNLSDYTGLSKDGVYELQAAATLIDNETGYVVAVVGSRTQEGIRGNVLNRAYQSYRQPGSSIKPIIVYTPYIQMGNNANTIVSDTYDPNGPRNVDNVYDGNITVRQAVKVSKNTVAWKLYQNEITPQVGVGFMLKMGFHKVWMDSNNVAASIGGFTYGTTTEEMAGAYATIENDGVYRKTTCITNILNSSGKTVVSGVNSPTKIYEVSASREMTDILKTVADEGTGQYAKPGNAIIAGKTGTTNDTKDVWFCGFSKYYSMAVWVGYDYPKAMDDEMANRPRLIFKDTFKYLHRNLPLADFVTNRNSGNQIPAETKAPQNESTASSGSSTSNSSSSGTVMTDANGNTINASSSNTTGSSGNTSTGGTGNTASTGGSSSITGTTTPPSTEITQPQTTTFSQTDVITETKTDSISDIIDDIINNMTNNDG